MPQPSCAAQTPFRRAILLTAQGEGVMRAELEDDFHHFRVVVDSAGGRVARMTGEAVRHPWSLCAAAPLELQALVGAPLSCDPTAVTRHADIRQQCTHLFDLAGLAMAGLARGVRARRYDMTLVHVAPERWRADLTRDDGLALAWSMTADAICAPLEWRGVSLKAGFIDWARAHFDADRFEAAVVLRRGAFVGKSRGRDLDARTVAIDGARNVGGCFVMQPARAALATRMTGSTWSFPPSGPGPLSPDGGD